MIFYLFIDNNLYPSFIVPSSFHQIALKTTLYHQTNKQTKIQTSPPWTPLETSNAPTVSKGSQTHNKPPVTSTAKHYFLFLLEVDTYSLLFASRLRRFSSSSVTPLCSSQSFFSCSKARRLSSSSRIWTSSCCKRINYLNMRSILMIMTVL